MSRARAVVDPDALTCGVDVGGTKIAAALVSASGEILAHDRVASPAGDAEDVEDAIAALVRGLAVDRPVAAVGVGAAGYVDAGRRVVMFAPNIAWRDAPLAEALERRLDLPVVVENDANAAAWGEFRFGAAADADDLLMMTIGTGVGGGLVFGGELFRGSFGAAAEIGHLRVVPGGRDCGCGRQGCLEQYGSGRALVAAARARALDPRGAALLARAGGDPDRIDGPFVTAAAQDGDPTARAALAEIGGWLGEALASLAAVLDPGVVVIGGGVSEAEDLLLDPLREAYGAHLSGRGHHPELEVRAAALGNDAGVIGAADLARR
ncbi:ROK family glucokinase [Nocardioides sp.]|uniref:ROK family glucokinase n=1 Tax=Nocardioides sp. TaxID=35761 RepID=UPI0035179DD1